MTADSTRAVLELTGLTVCTTESVTLVDDVSLTLRAGEVHALVGESGSGKTMTANALIGLLPGAAKVRSGRALVGGVELLALDERARAAHRGRTIAMVPQEPLAALNPVLTVGAQLVETIATHAQGRDARARALELLAEVGLSEPERRLRSHPHQLSGGMRQRVLIALALACEPAVLIADEPTTALDATLRGVVLQLLRRLAHARGLAVLLITHDLELVRESCDAVSVMYAGRLVEQATAAELFARPRHPYTAALLRARPHAAARGGPLPAIEGVVPAPSEHIAGCRFHPRCPKAQERCRLERPLLSGGAACWFPEGA